MACLVKKSHVHSPESTVSSLLASCSLNSSSGSLNPHNSIQYKDKLYSSASQALEAYIEDFDLSLASPDTKPGKICITQSTPKDFSYSEDNFKCKRALGNLKQRETRRGSVVPYLRRKVADELDVLSLTTDDLLALPPDGSASFTQSGVLRTAPLTSSLSTKSRRASAARVCHQTPSFGQKELHFPDSSLDRDSGRRMHATHSFYRPDSVLPVKTQLTEHGNSQSVSHQNYPRWLTSQKSDLSISGISSIPDFKYPIWLKDHNLLSDTSSENSALPQDIGYGPTCLQDNRKLVKSQTLDRPITAYPGNDDVLDLQHKQDKTKSSQYGVPHVSSIPQLLKDQKDPFQDDGTVSLLQEVRRTLESSDELNTPLKNDGSPCSVDILEAQRSWDNVPVGLRSPVPVCCEDENLVLSPKANIVNGFLEDCLKNSSQESTFSGGNHHGPVEALKLMLFNLQAVQHSFNQDKTAGQKDVFKKTLDDDWEFKLCDGEMIPIRQSLQRALHHLSRLKCLVEDSGGKEESKEDKDINHTLS